MYRYAVREVYEKYFMKMGDSFRKEFLKQVCSYFKYSFETLLQIFSY